MLNEVRIYIANNSFSDTYTLGETGHNFKLCKTKIIKSKLTGSVRVKNKQKIGLSIEEVRHTHLGLYRVRVTNPKTETVTTATTRLKFDYNHFPDFQKLDIEREGLISKEMMIQAMCATDTYLTEQEIRKFIKNSDCMKADHVNFNEYVRYIKFAKRNSVRPLGRELQLDEEDKKEGGDEKKDEGTVKKDKSKKKGKDKNGAEGAEE